MFVAVLVLILSLNLSKASPGPSRSEKVGPGSFRLDKVGPGFLDRLSRQLKESDNSLSVELVGALQSWATSLESGSGKLLEEIEALKASNDELKASFDQLEAEVSEMRQVNLNLKNDVSAANDRTLNLKDNYMKAREEINNIETNINKRVDEQAVQLNILISEQGKDLSKKLDEQAEVLNIQILDGNTYKRLQAEFQAEVQRNNTGIEVRISELLANKMITAEHLIQLNNSVAIQNSSLNILQQREKGLSLGFQQVEESILDLQILLDKQVKSVSERLEGVDQTLVFINSSLVSEDRFAEKVLELETKLETVTSTTTALTANEEKLTNGHQLLSDSYQEIVRSHQKLATSFEKLESSQDNLKNNQAELARSQEKIASGGQELLISQQKLSISFTDLEASYKTLEESVQKLETSYTNLVESHDGLSNSNKEMLINHQKLLYKHEELSKSHKELLNRNDDLASSNRELVSRNQLLQTTDLKAASNMDLYSNITSNLDLVSSKLESSLTSTRNTLAQMITRIDKLETKKPEVDVSGQVSVLKTNVIGLGNYINSVNRELGELSNSVRSTDLILSMKTDQMNETIWRIESNLEDLQRSGLAGGSGSDAESSNPTLRADLKDLRNNFDTFKTTVNKEVEAVKTGFSVINNNLDVLSTGLQDLTTVSQLSESRSSRALEELSSLKSSVLALQELQEMDSQSKEDIDAIKNSLSEIQAKDDDNRLVLVEKNVSDLLVNMTLISAVATSSHSDLETLMPGFGLIEEDISNIRNGITQLSKALESASDPARFSCGVTGEEIKVSGVVVYDECFVNSKNMMNKETGHVTVPETGDYLLSFSANMVSVNSQAIWCALYKQSPGEEGWQVLGMINNYQQDAGEEDDRDSGSLSILSPLSKGDQVWVEWRGYGDSFLYSNPYKLISFSGFRVSGGL
ncbi:GRIP and coiled-coil domain-containing protein C27D7.02c [Eurytemora carolleeae]|uniref:GRIP and coiled-coil domain-containing protein C27D7.02c n=1 Tax=Eurytemora carolleeae TaxID=1294199 RepID=UPI000C779928|nr:GRIP and coiled-coil domain-containing protein C27D7.02c [Eurytemora carolleeae]|eukprot:XP_023338151.1 GRIP and coiled-coil domain-containing protein C27D7.02c-like [Eurytemora affinis]